VCTYFLNFNTDFYSWEEGQDYFVHCRRRRPVDCESPQGKSFDHKARKKSFVTYLAVGHVMRLPSAVPGMNILYGIPDSCSHVLVSFILSFKQAPEFLKVNGGFVETTDGKSPQGDMYSCAIAIWELWFKIAPFNNQVDTKVVKHLQKGRRLPMSIAGGSSSSPSGSLIPPPLEALIESLWQHDPARRATAPQALLKARNDVFPALMMGEGNG
jgi:hypothetical protein